MQQVEYALSHKPVPKHNTQTNTEAQGSFIGAPWLIHVCAMTHPYVKRAKH